MREMIENLRALLAAATPGEWFATDTGKSGRNGSLTHQWGGRDPGMDARVVWSVSTNPSEAGWETDGGCSGYGVSKANADFIAAAKNHMVELLDEIERLQKIERMRDMIDAALSEDGAPEETP